MNINDASTKWNMKRRSVERVVDNRRVGSYRNSSGEVIISDDEIPSLKVASIQSLLWVVVKSKNDSKWSPDISKVSGLPVDQLISASHQLSLRKNADGLDGIEATQQRFNQCRITELGLELLHKRPLLGGVLGFKDFKDTALGIGVIFDHPIFSFSRAWGL